MLVSHMLYRTAQSSEAHRTESVTVMGHELTMGVSSTGSDQNSKTSLDVCPYLVVLERGTTTIRSPAQRNGSDHYSRLIQTLVSTVQSGMLVRLDTDTCTLCIQFSAERAANVIDFERQW